MKQDSPGFSLLELVVAAAIITTVIAWSIPNYMRTVKQGEVDRYNRAIESGFQNLQESLVNQNNHPVSIQLTQRMETP